MSFHIEMLIQHLWQGGSIESNNSNQQKSNNSYLWTKATTTLCGASPHAAAAVAAAWATEMSRGPQLNSVANLLAKLFGPVQPNKKIRQGDEKGDHRYHTK
jgi:hypothetical protein